MQALTYVELDIIWCPLTFGVAPCQAVGTPKCFQTKNTCLDLAHFNIDPLNSPTEQADPITLRFAIPTDYLPADIEAIPSIEEINFDPATISLGIDLGQRATVTIRFRDHPWSDTGEGFDKYVSERSYDPFRQGSFWGKFRARQPYLRGRNLRLIRGFLGETLAEMEERHFIVESFDGPTPDGFYTLIAKDVLKLAAGDRAQAPAISSGFLSTDVTATADVLTLLPSGIGADEYPTTGYASIGGSEIVQFHRIGSPLLNDPDTLLMVHCDGADAATTFTDSSSYARAVTRNGNTVVDTAESKFGGASALFDGAGDSLSCVDSADWQFAGDFTIDGWFRSSDLSVTRCLYGQGTASNNEMSLVIGTTGILQFQVISGGSTLVLAFTAAGVITVNTWYHVAVVRSGNNWTIFVDGDSKVTAVAAITYPNYGAVFRFGLANFAVSWSGWIDEFRVSEGARWTTDFTPPTFAYPTVTTTDQMGIVRAQYNTEASTHETQDRVQLCLQYASEDPADIIYDLMVTYAGVPAAYILLDAWQTETAAFLNNNYTTLIAEPTPVEKLVAELIEQAALSIWWDDRERLLRLQVLREISTQVDHFDEDNILQGTLEISEQPDKRISQVLTYFGQINPLGGQDDPSNYRSVATTIDTEAEENYGSPAVKKVYSRWIPAGGKTVAERVNDIQLVRYRDAPRRFNFDLFRDGILEPLLGRGYRVESYVLQDATGAAVDAPVQITRLRPEAERFVIEAEEILIGGEPLDPTQHPIIIDTDTNNVNLRTLHDSLYADAISGDIVTCTIEAGVVVGSTSRLTSAFDVGSWAGGVIVVLEVVGRIAGMGGDGGRGSGTAGSATDGEAGGTALYLRRAISLDCTGGGQIWGGGGAGGGGSAVVSGPDVYTGGGGGGGAGRVASVGGLGGSGPGSADDGDPGTDTAGGAGGNASPGSDGGDGGGPGLAGQDGADQSPQVYGDGGAAGNAIDGVSFVTVVVAGDVRGGQVN